MVKTFILSIFRVFLGFYLNFACRPTEENRYIVRKWSNNKLGGGWWRGALDEFL